MNQRKLLVSGATGFVGSAIITQLRSKGDVCILAGTRRDDASFPAGVTPLQLGDLGNPHQTVPLHDVEAVIHSAARVHIMNDHSADPLAEFRKTNVDGTLNLARQAAEAGVRRFIFISSIKVNGEGTEPGRPYTADDVPAPVDPYGISKLEAEQGLLTLAAETGLEVVIIRPVLVYGPGVKANFCSMMTWLNKGIPLPLGATGNKRSLVALDNLVDLILTCIDHPAAANQVFLVSDGEDLSTTELLQCMSVALGKTARLLPVPASWLDAAARLLGKGAIAQRLCGSLQVDIEKTCRVLNWTPPVSVDQALRKTANHFLESR